MKTRIMLVVALLIGFSGCVTLTESNTFHFPIQIENDDVSATLYFSDAKWIELRLHNKTDNVLTLVVDLASFTQPNGSSTRLIPGGTRYIDSAASQPPVTIPPKGNYTHSFSAASAATYVSGQYGGWRINDWIPRDLSGSTFIFGYSISGGQKFLIFSGDISEASETEPEPILGTVTVSKTYWNIFFLYSIENRRNDLYELALDEAQDQYGKDVTLNNLSYVGEWNPRSLLLYFSMFGFVEDASLTADVVRSE